MDIRMDKEEIRVYIKEKRYRMSEEEKQKKSRKAAEEAIRFLKDSPRLLDSGWLYCYMDLKKEAGTRDILDWCFSNKIRTAIPRIEGEKMNFYEILSLDDCIIGTMGIQEPKVSCCLAQEASKGRSIDCPVLVPGLAFGLNGNRIGYGKGYYDRFLSEEPEHMAIGYCFLFQTSPAVPGESHDRRMDGLVTEKGAMWLRK
ncbi:5-formyltetrahydrofolate cyclo-ligase [Lachnospiraceae bacterium 62-35]